MTMEDGRATRLADDLWVLDTQFLDEPGLIASYLLTGEAGLGLVDVGSGATLDHLLASVRAAGYDPAELEHIVLTHIHLDHAGAAGALTRVAPRARVYVSAIGAPHLIEPSKLLVSAERIYGDLMQRLWGTMEPVPADRIVALGDGAELRVGDRTLRALYTPGHAVHHLAYHDAASGGVFTGDVAGVKLEGVDYARPPTPPPDLNLDDWNASLDRLLALDPTAFYLPHFGRVTNIRPHVEEVRRRLAEWADVTLAGIRAGKTDRELAADLASLCDDDIRRAAPGTPEEREAAVRRYEMSANYLMSAQGYVRYYKKVRPEALR